MASGFRGLSTLEREPQLGTLKRELQLVELQLGLP